MRRKLAKKACEESLRRLHTDHIDVYQMHHVDRLTPWDEIWQAMEQLVQEGKIIYVGSSNFAGWDIATAQAKADNRHLLGLISEQAHYNLSSRGVELELISALEYYGLGLIPWSPLGGGLLAGSLQKNKGSSRRDGAGIGGLPQEAEQLQSSLTRYEKLCADIGESAANVAIAWLLSRSVVSSVLVGSRTSSQLVSSLHALDIKLTEETLQELNFIWPGPGSAPEAYAW
ncbi:MAG: aldo/keto reductase [Bifidobacterium sp.]